MAAQRFSPANRIFYLRLLLPRDFRKSPAQADLLLIWKLPQFCGLANFEVYSFVGEQCTTLDYNDISGKSFAEAYWMLRRPQRLLL